MTAGKIVMPDEDITQISLGRFRVGITGLKAAIEEAKILAGAS